MAISNNLQQEFQTPTGNRELFTFPAIDQLEPLIEENRRLYSNLNFDLLGHPAPKLRESLRHFSVNKGMEFSKGIGIPFDEQKSDQPFHTLILCGHQPVFYHPGILVKNLLLNRLQKMEGRIGINLIVDSDSFTHCSFRVPRMDSNSLVKEFSLFQDPSQKIFEHLSQGTFPDIREFLARVPNKLLGEGPLKNYLEPYKMFLRKIQSVSTENLDLVQTMTLLRRKYEKELGSSYLELPLSTLCKTIEFQIFALAIVLEGTRFAQILNHKLQEYRKTQKIKNRANPFPDLLIEGDRVETPFWILSEGSREPLFVEFKSDRVILRSSKKALIRLPTEDPGSMISRIRWEGIQLRPRAVALSLFVRLMLSDLFIHGIGGAKYDVITDQIGKEFFQVDLPKYATISATMYLPLGENDHSDEIRKRKAELRNMDQHPEKHVHLDDQDEETKMAVKEKKEIQKRFKESGADKKELNKKLKLKNNFIRQVLSDRMRDLTTQIQELEIRQEIFRISSYREYPIFLYPSEVIDSLIR